MILIFIIIGAILALADVYLLFGVMSGRSWWLRLMVMLPTFAYFGVLAWMAITHDLRQLMLNLLFWLTLCVFFTILLFVLVSLSGRLVGLFWRGAPLTFNIIGLVVAAVWLGIALYGIMYGWKRVTVEEVTVESRNLPASFDGYRIVQLSDFHIGTYRQSPQTVNRIVDSVNALAPDLIVFTGDLVNSSSEEVKPFAAALSRLRARDGVLSVLGNHDYCLYREYSAPDSPTRQLRQLCAVHDSIGWTLLRNANRIVRRDGDSIAIVGVENAGSRMFPDKSDLKGALNGVEQAPYKILLSHDPTHWRREVLPHSDIDLMLAGHTHAMQFKLGGWSPSSWTYRELGGMYVEGDRRLYVSTGTGGNIAFRFGAWPQITLITLRPAH